MKKRIIMIIHFIIMKVVMIKTETTYILTASIMVKKDYKEYL